MNHQDDVTLLQEENRRLRARLQIKDDELAELTYQLSLAKASCYAALKYNDSLAGLAARGHVDIRDEIGTIQSDELDVLYADWIKKAREAVEG